MKTLSLKICIAILALSVIVSGCTGIMTINNNVLTGLTCLTVSVVAFFLIALINSVEKKITFQRTNNQRQSYKK